MKKVLNLVLVIVIICICFVGCKVKKTPQTPESFTTIMEYNGFRVSDATENVDTDTPITNALIATNDDFKIQFYQFKDAEAGRVMIEYIEEGFNQISINFSVVKVNEPDYGYYAFADETKFYMVTHLDNTLLYCVTDKEYEDDVVRIIEKLGYR